MYHSFAYYTVFYKTHEVYEFEQTRNIFVFRIYVMNFDKLHINTVI